jgi:uncharacterized membrane protein YeaQ/YmgE (transglycosylase-associated protein family)
VPTSAPQAELRKGSAGRPAQPAKKAGWPTGFVVNGSGYGLMGDMALGLVGSLLGSWISLALGVSVGTALVSLVVVVSIGAVILIGAQRLLWHVST